MQLTPPYMYIPMFPRQAAHLTEASSHVSRRCRMCAAAIIGEVSHPQLQPLVMSPPTVANCKLTFLTGCQMKPSALHAMAVQTKGRGVVVIATNATGASVF